MSSVVTLKVYDAPGREVATPANEVHPVSDVEQPGTCTVQWGARLRSANAGGQASGVYLYRLQSGKSVDVKKLVLLK